MPARTHRSTRSQLAVAFALTLATTACSSLSQLQGRPPDDGLAVASDGRHFSTEAIRATGATNAWQVLERLAISMQPRLDGNGDPGSLGRSRAAYRYNDPQTTLVVLNGMRIPDLRVLRNIPASEIAQMQVLSSTRAQILYGNDGWNGAIIVETFQPQR